MKVIAHCCTVIKAAGQEAAPHNTHIVESYSGDRQEDRLSPGVPGCSVLQRSGVCSKSSINTVIFQDGGPSDCQKKGGGEVEPTQVGNRGHNQEQRSVN